MSRHASIFGRVVGGVLGDRLILSTTYRTTGITVGTDGGKVTGVWGVALDAMSASRSKACPADASWKSR